jgi:hypothetical protein
MMAAADRLAAWRTLGATPAEAEELAAYAHIPLHDQPAPTAASWQRPEPACVETWERYVEEAASEGVAATLRRRLVQLQFSIATGISESAGYRAATRRGILANDDPLRQPIPFVRPEGLCLFLHPTVVGRVPVVATDHRDDFESLVRALTERNEPVPIPPSMGACIVAGYNNWDRIATLRRQWAASGGDDSNDGWAEEFRRVVPRKELYQDRFILLSSGPYSATPAVALGLSQSDWADISFRIRLEHECAHYFMRETFGSMRNALLDELVADFAGMIAATGEFRSDWFLRFLGLESYPSYRESGRLHNYRGSLSGGAFGVLRSIACRAARNVESFQVRFERTSMTERAHAMTALAWIGLEGLASDSATELLFDALAAITGHWPDAEFTCERSCG